MNIYDGDRGSAVKHIGYKQPVGHQVRASAMNGVCETNGCSGRPICVTSTVIYDI